MTYTKLVVRALCACCGAVALAACDTPVRGEPSEPVVISAPSAEGRASALTEVEDKRVLLHALDDRQVHGHLAPSVPFGDAIRTVTLQRGLETVGLEAGTKVLDLQLVPQGALVIHLDHTLKLHAADKVRELDTGVEAPLSVASGHVAYVAGNAPMLKLRRARIDGGEPETLAPSVQTAWSPVLSPDAQEVVFSASLDGRSALARVDAEGFVHQLETRRVPSASVAPHHRGRHLVFQDEAGVAVYDLEQEKLVSEYPGATLLPDYRGGETWVQPAGSTERVTVEVPR